MKNSLNIGSFIFFSSFLNSLKDFSWNFNVDILCLVFAFVAFFFGSVVACASVAGSFATSGYVSGSGVGSCVGISSTFFIGSNVLLKLLRSFSLSTNDNPKLFKKDFSGVFVPFSKFFNSMTKLLCL